MANDVTTFRINEAGLRELINGPVNKHAHKIGFEIVSRARRYAGIDSGRLRRKISYSVYRLGTGYGINIIADTRYALMHHEGTRPHRIVPTTGKFLRFKAGGRVVYARKVFHPGTRANPFLVRAMREVVR